ncbi:MAG: hypothetical protein AB1Z31_28745, partial [Desulfobacterales bacterium]
QRFNDICSTSIYSRVVKHNAKFFIRTPFINHRRWPDLVPCNMLSRYRWNLLISYKPVAYEWSYGAGKDNKTSADPVSITCKYVIKMS